MQQSFECVNNHLFNRQSIVCADISDPCKNMTCSGADQEYQVCRSAMCRCPECKFVPVSPVCGDAGTTFSSECELRKKACEKTVNDTAVQYDGKCDDSSKFTNSRYHLKKSEVSGLILAYFLFTQAKRSILLRRIFFLT